MKVILALHRADPDLLLGQDLRHRLHSLGADSLQVNLDDEHVAPAQLRLAVDSPIVAVASVQGDLDHTAVLELLGRHDPELAAWVVEERCPLPPPAADDGTRTPALSNIAFLRRPPSMAYDDWRADWLGRHTSIAIETQATFGYVQNVVVESLTGVAADVAGIVEELFPMAALTDLHAFYGSDGEDAELRRRINAMLESVARFGADQRLDLVPTSRYAFRLGGA